MSDSVIEQHWLGDIPYVIVSPKGIDDAPWVVVQHGYTGSLETEVPYGIKMAEAGFRALVTEADLHGHRKSPETERRFNASFGITIGELVIKSTREIQLLLDHLAIDRCGFFGISMGGFIAYRLACTDPRVRLLSPLIASPATPWAFLFPEAEQAQILALEALSHPDLLKDRRIYAQNGVDDEGVPIQPTRDMVELMRQFGANMEATEYLGQGHVVTDQMVDRAIAWLVAHTNDLDAA